jgi:hypothetical protein
MGRYIEQYLLNYGAAYLFEDWKSIICHIRVYKLCYVAEQCDLGQIGREPPAEADPPHEQHEPMQV